MVCSRVCASKGSYRFVRQRTGWGKNKPKAKSQKPKKNNSGNTGSACPALQNPGVPDPRLTSGQVELWLIVLRKKFTREKSLMGCVHGCVQWVSEYAASFLVFPSFADARKKKWIRSRSLKLNFTPTQRGIPSQVLRVLASMTLTSIHVSYPSFSTWNSFFRC